MICEHCGWVVPLDCTCRGATDWMAEAMLVQVVADRHRQAVMRAYASDGRTIDDRPGSGGQRS
jgi:hypothetical protein